MSEPKRVRRRGYLTDDKLIPYGTYIETFADDPADWDELIEAANKVIEVDDSPFTKSRAIDWDKSIDQLRNALKPKEPTNE